MDPSLGELFANDLIQILHVFLCPVAVGNKGKWRHLAHKVPVPVLVAILVCLLAHLTPLPCLDEPHLPVRQPDQMLEMWRIRIVLLAVAATQQLPPWEAHEPMESILMGIIMKMNQKTVLNPTVNKLPN